MKLSKAQVKNLIRSVISEDREPLKDMLDHENVEDVIHATYETWAGAGDSENLVMPIDHYAITVDDDDPIRSQEVIDHGTDKVVSIEDRGSLKLSEAQLRTSIRKILNKSL
jgi:hypothetical protein